MTESPPVANLQYESSTIQSRPLGQIIGFVGLRLIGVYLVVTSVASVPWLAYYTWEVLVNKSAMFGANSGPVAILSYVGPLVYLALGIVLFYKAPAWSRRMFGQLHDDGRPISVEQVLTIAIAAIGLWFCVSSIGDLINVFSNIAGSDWRRASNNNFGSTALLDSRTVTILLVALMQPALGVGLIVYASVLSRFGIRKFHYV